MAFTCIKIIDSQVRIQHGFRILLFYQNSQGWKKLFVKLDEKVQSWVYLEFQAGICQLLTHSLPEVRQLAKKINQRGFEYFDALWDLRFELGPQCYTQFKARGDTLLYYVRHKQEKIFFDPYLGPALTGPTGLTGLTGPTGPTGLTPTGRLSSKTPNLSPQILKPQKKQSPCLQNIGPAAPSRSRGIWQKIFRRR